MWGKAVTIAIGLIVVTGAGFLIASQNPKAPAEEVAPVAPASIEQTAPIEPSPPAPEAPPTQKTEDRVSTAEETTAAALPPSPPPSPSSPPPAPSVSAPKPASASGIPAGLEGLWKATKKIVLDKATKAVIREENIANFYAFYNSYKGNRKCYNVELAGSEPLCAGGYELFTMRSDGYIVEEGGIATDKFSNGTLEATYELPTTIERHLYTKISPTPAPEP